MVSRDLSSLQNIDLTHAQTGGLLTAASLSRQWIQGEQQKVTKARVEDRRGAAKLVVVIMVLMK